MTARRAATAPKHLSRAAGELYRAVMAAYDLEAHHVAILVKSLEAHDRGEAAREIVAREGLLIDSRLGERKPHPAVAIERDSRAAFLAGVRQLGLDLEGPPPPSSRQPRR